MDQDATHHGISTTRLALIVNESAVGQSRRQELAGFLRTRRDALAPADVGLPNTNRRRVKGLRREEVAEAAGISVVWYTWIEQARDLKLSEATLESLSQALNLGATERAHLYQLAGFPEPLPRPGHNEQIMQSVRDVIASMDPNPSYVLDTHWNILAWNKGTTTIFGDFGEIPARERNFMRLIFANLEFRSLFVNWEEVAHCTMAHFRADSVSHVDDPQWLGLIDDLNSQSVEFKEWWPRHNVVWPYNWEKQLKHPEHGSLFYNTFDLEIFRPARIRIVTYIPTRRF